MKTSFNIKRNYKLCFLFLGMKKKSSSLPAFTGKFLVFQQHEIAVRPQENSKYKNGRERRFCLALANHMSPKNILPLIPVQQSSCSHIFLVWWGVLWVFG